MLGFDALGHRGIGQLPSTTVAQALFCTIGAAAKARSQGSFAFNATATIVASAKARGQWSGLASIAGRVKAVAKAKVTPGVILKTIINGQAKANVSPGILITARMVAQTYAAADIHVEGKTTGQRDPLLLNSSSQFTASYWKGRS